MKNVLIFNIIEFSHKVHNAPFLAEKQIFYLKQDTFIVWELVSSEVRLKSHLPKI